MIREPERMTSAELRATLDAPAKPKSRLWSYATPTHCKEGHRHASKLEARVCDRLERECAESGDTLFRQMRLPLISSAPNHNKTAGYLTVDFAIVRRGKLIRLIDAKSKRVSRDWARGARACEASWGVTVEETDR